MRQFLRKCALLAVLPTITLVGMTQPVSAAPSNPTFRTQVTPNGVGDLLIFGYWTTGTTASAPGETENRNTLLAIENVFGGQLRRFVHVTIYEGINSTEALNFTICLSPGDVWTAAIAPSLNNAADSRLVVGDPGSCDASVANSSLTPPPLPSDSVPLQDATFGYISAYTMECNTVSGCPSGDPSNDDDGGDDTLMGTATIVSPIAGYSSSYNGTSFIGFDALNESADIHNVDNNGRAHDSFTIQGPDTDPMTDCSALLNSDLPQQCTGTTTGSTRNDVANALASEGGVNKEILLGRYTASQLFNSSTDVVLTFPTGDQPGTGDPVSMFIFDEKEVFTFSPRGIILNWEVNICRFFNGGITESGSTEIECNGGILPGPDSDIVAGQSDRFTGGWFRILNNNDLIGPNYVLTPASVVGGNTIPAVTVGAAAIGDGTGVESNSINEIPDGAFPAIGLVFSFFDGDNGIFDQAYPIQWAAVTGPGGIGGPDCTTSSNGFDGCNSYAISNQYAPHVLPDGMLLPANDTSTGRNRRSDSGMND